MFLLTILACIETGISEDKVAAGATSLDPDILVDPTEIQFPVMDMGDSAVLSFTVTNTGADRLDVREMLVTGTSAFTILDNSGPFSLDFKESRTFNVTFTPVNPEDQGTVSIYSNDPGDPVAYVELYGGAAVPELVVSPNPYNFGKVLENCSAPGTLYLQNVGEANLTVQSVVESSAPFSVLTDGFPMLIAPTEVKTVELSFAPPDVGQLHQTQLWVTSDSIFGPVAVNLSGEGTNDGDITDEFVQGDGPWDRTDILVYVDQSGSMDDDQRNLANNFNLLVQALASLALDWQLMVSTADDGCHNGSILNATSPNAQSSFLQAVSGNGGRFTEAGLTVAANALEATGPGLCNAGFLREDSKTMVVLVSDEPEQSTVAWSEQVAAMKAVSPTTSITSIVGEVPYGCLTAAAGTGYYEATVATGGAFLSICSPDWGDYFQTIAAIAATGQTDTFPLSSRPDPSTIVVEVADVPTTTGWSYNSDANAIIFAEGSVPAPNSRITATYELLSDCSG